MLRVALFGPLTVEVDGHLVPPPAGLRPRALLAWLLLHPGRHARTRVAATFWPDVLDTAARASLRTTLCTVRAALDAAAGGAYLEADRDAVGIADHLPRDVDVERFDALARQEDPEALRAAYELAGRPLLADLSDDWVLEARDRYRELAGDVALRLADVLEERADLGGAVTWTRRALVHLPLRESAHRALVRRLAEAGEPGEALAAYGRCRAVLASEFGAVPSEDTEALAARLRSTGTAGTAGGLPAATGPPRPPPEPPLVGRTRERGLLTRAWDRARRGSGGVVVLSGAAGLGKSRLAAELSGRAERDGARCGAGAAYDLPGTPPFAPWTEALHELLTQVPAPPAHVAWPGDLARLCRAVEWRWERPASAASADPDQERMWLFEAVAEALAWAARDRPVVVLLEDLHLADPSTIALLTSVGRRLTRLPGLLVVTRRPAGAGEDLALAVDALARRDALVAEVALGPLSPAETGEVVRSAAPRLPGRTCARVVAAARGNPLLAREAARAAVAGRDLADGLRGWVRAPLARLGGSGRLLVDVVAAAGRPLDLGEAADLVGAEALEAALAEACRQELLVAVARRVRFVHDLVRDACYAELGPGRRAWLHGRLADVLDVRPGRSAGEVARHLLLAERREEARARLATAARHARAVGALDEAAAFLREALAVRPAPSAPDAAELELALAEVAAGRGSREEHDRAFARAVDLLAGAGDDAGLAAAHLARGQCLRTALCFPREAAAAYEQALRIVDEGGLDAPELRALALAGRAWVETASGDVTRGREALAQVAELPEVAADAALAADLALARGVAALRSHRYPDAERESRLSARTASRAGRHDLAAAALLQAAWAAAARGAEDESLRLADRVLRGRYGPGLAAAALAARAHVLSRMGRHGEARAAAEEELALLGRTRETGQETLAAYDLGSVALAAGDFGEAVRQLTAALDGDDEQLPRVLARLRLAEARLGAGDRDEADAEVARVPFEPVGAADLPAALVPVLERVQGLLAAARGDVELALWRLEAAETGWRRLLDSAPPGDPHVANVVGASRPPIGGVVEPAAELSRVLADRSRVLAACGRSDEARTAAREAAALASDGRAEGLRQPVGVGA